MPPSNRAAWIKTIRSDFVIDGAPYTRPSADEIVIRAKAFAINPADYIIQSQGFLLTEDQYPIIEGCDVAGDVVEVPTELRHRFSVGDCVIGSCNCLITKDGVYCYSAFQEYVVLKTNLTAKIPDHIKYHDAVVLPVATSTSSSGMYPSSSLALTPPTEGSKSDGETLLVWGASSSVGSCAVQLATQAGYEVVGIASKKNHDMVKRLGAKACFDYSSPTLVDDVLEFLKGKNVVGAYDAISTDATLPVLCEILDRCGGRKMISAVQPGSEEKASRGVTITTNFTVDQVNEEGCQKAWQYIEKGLEDGTMQCMPPAEIVGTGLESLQGAVNLIGKGVSAKKLVVVM